MANIGLKRTPCKGYSLKGHRWRSYRPHLQAILTVVSAGPGARGRFWSLRRLASGAKSATVTVPFRLQSFEAQLIAEDGKCNHTATMSIGLAHAACVLMMWG